MKHSILFEPTGGSFAELVDRGSRFVAEVVPLNGAADARKRVADVRGKHPSASHVVHAFVVGVPGSTTEGSSDDGEPRSTAGKPVLEAIRGRRLTNVIVTVARYFGGTKLGTGGLVRAYGGVAAKALDEVPRREVVLRDGYRVAVGYDLYEAVKRIIESHSGTIVEATFEADIRLTGALPQSQWDRCCSALAEASNGTIQLFRTDNETGQSGRFISR